VSLSRIPDRLAEASVVPVGNQLNDSFAIQQIGIDLAEDNFTVEAYISCLRFFSLISSSFYLQAE
jgi:hypothetical protein